MYLSQNSRELQNQLNVSLSYKIFKVVLYIRVEQLGKLDCAEFKLYESGQALCYIFKN